MDYGTVYDCSSPEGAPATPSRWLHTAHAQLAADCAASLSALLRCPVDVRLTGIEEVPYGGFIADLGSPTCCYLLKADALDERLLLDIEPAILHPMIDRMLGGGEVDEPAPCRPLTEIELRLTARVVRLLLKELEQAWQDVSSPGLDILQMESNPRPLRLLPGDEPVFSLGLEVTLGQQRGLVRLCLPCRMVERLAGMAAVRRRDDSLVELRVTMAETHINGSELSELRVGDIITTETDAGSAMIVSIDGAPRFHAKPGIYQGRKAIVISDEIPPA